MKKAVIFDLDDTLISEDEYIRSGYRAVSSFLKDMYGWDERMTSRQLYDLYLEDSLLVLLIVFLSCRITDTI